MSETVSETGCCPKFDPAPWDEQEVVFEDQLFLEDRVRCLFHIPLNFGSVMKRCMNRILEADALDTRQIVLSDTNSLWSTDVLIALSKEIPGAKMRRISGTYRAKVFDGPYSHVGKWTKELAASVAAQGKALKHILFYYTTCPRCAKAYGHNYVVLLGRI